jgi:hypothetical protein
MASLEQEAPLIGNILRWLTDDTSCATYPYIDRGSGIGQGGASPKRTLLNEGIVESKLFWTTAVHAAIATSTTATSFVGAKAGPAHPGASTAGTFPAGYLNRVGAGFRIVSVGTVKTSGTPDLTIAVTLGTAAIYTSGALTLVSTVNPMPYRFEFNGFVVTTGAAGTILGQGQFIYTPAGVTCSQISTAMTAVTVDLTAALAVDATAKWSASHANNDFNGQLTYAEYW